MSQWSYSYVRMWPVRRIFSEIKRAAADNALLSSASGLPCRAALLSPYWLRTEVTQRVRITHALPPAHPPRSPRGLVWCHGISAAVAHGPCRPCSLPSVTRINEPPARLRNPASGCLSAVTSDTVGKESVLVAVPSLQMGVPCPRSRTEPPSCPSDSGSRTPQLWATFPG